MKFPFARKSRRGDVELPVTRPAETVSDAGPLTFAFTSELVVQKGNGGDAAEALRRTALELVAQHVGRGRRSLAVCGVTRGVGVSFLSINLAAALALDGVSTLVVDADLANPSLEHFVRPSRVVPGLQQYLASGDMSRDSVIYREVAPNLSLLYAGGVAQRPSELIGHARFSELIQTCMREHDLVIVDTPPASLTADARHIAAVAHYALVVARARATHVVGVDELSRSLREDGVEIVGSILNAV